MALRKGVVIFGCLLLSVFSMRARAQDKDVKDGDTAAQGHRELNFAGTPYIYTGPDTGLGAGFAIEFRDLLRKEGRDVTFSADYTQTRYQDASVSWGEPYFLSRNARLNLSIGYDNKPAIRFYGFGNDSRRNHNSNWSWIKYNFQPEYVYRWTLSNYGALGTRVRVGWDFVNPDNGDLKDKSDHKYYRTIKQVHPLLYHSTQFDPTNLVHAGVTLYFDTRKDRFPLGGGREEVVWPVKGTYTEVSYNRYDKAMGSDFSWNNLGVSLTQVFPVFSQDTILVVHEVLTVNQGNTPFYMQASFGGGNTLRGYYSYRFIDNDATELNVELRQGIAPNWEWSLFSGVIKLKYPSLLLFWDEARVYHDYTEIWGDLGKDYHYTWGYGFRFVITPTVVIRAEWGYSHEQATLELNAGLPF
jgi:hypothetical protein